MGLCEYIGIMMADQRWPLPNVWLGVSVEDQKTADERIPILLDTPAAKRIVSYEPALGPVDFSEWLIVDPYYATKCEHCGWIGASSASPPVIEDDIACPKCLKSIVGDDGPTIYWTIEYPGDDQ